jgi:membrane protease YdiL (CAAX protease family)
MTVRRRVACELAALALLTPLFLALVPERSIWLNLGLALLAGGLVLGLARDTRERVWTPPVGRAADRFRHSTRHMLYGTLGVCALFAAAGALIAYDLGGDGDAVLERLARPSMLLALAAFVPWALLQQMLFQFYLLGRLRALLPGAPPAGLAGLNGLLFGAVHLPDWDVALLTIVGGSVWSWYYQRDRCLVPIAISHATLGTAYFYWVRGQDLVGQWLAVG